MTGKLLLSIIMGCYLLACSPTNSDTAQATLGKINFPTSGKPEAKEHFLRGVAALHSFWYPEALEAFHKAREADPDFAMAYWGEAMSYNRTFWQVQDKEAAISILKGLGPDAETRLAKAPTEKEKKFLQSLDVLFGDEKDKLKRDWAYMRFMRSFYEQNPEDPEVAAFYALSLLGVLRNNQGNEKERMEAAAVAQRILAQNPEHPGAVHYLIHAVDDPLHATLGLEAARTYAKIAPESNHALHMPSHIFVQLGLWEEVIKSNIAAFAASEKWVAKKALTDADLDFHSLAWLSYGYQQAGQFDKAKEKLDLIRAIKDEVDAPRADFYAADMRARQIVESGQWEIIPFEETEQRKQSGYGRCGEWLATGLSALNLGQPEVAAKALAKMQTMKENYAVEQEDYYVKLVSVNELALQAFQAYVNGKKKMCQEFFEQAVAIEESLNPPTGPPDVVKPVHELYGEVLLEIGEGQKAMVQFQQALQRMPNRSASVLGVARAAVLLADKVTAYRQYQLLLENWKNADPERKAFMEAQQFVEEHIDQKKENMATYLPIPLRKPLDQQLSISQCLPASVRN